MSILIPILCQHVPHLKVFIAIEILGKTLFLLIPEYVFGTVWRGVSVLLMSAVVAGSIVSACLTYIWGLEPLFEDVEKYALVFDV